MCLAQWGSVDLFELLDEAVSGLVSGPGLRVA